MCFGPQIRGHVSLLDLITSVFTQFSSCKVKHTISDVKKVPFKGLFAKNPPFKSHYWIVMICGTNLIVGVVHSVKNSILYVHVYQLDDLDLLRVINRKKLKILPLANECLTWGE